MKRALKKRKRRLKSRASQLMDEDLVEVLRMRQAASAGPATPVETERTVPEDANVSEQTWPPLHTWFSGGNDVVRALLAIQTDRRAILYKGKWSVAWVIKHHLSALPAEAKTACLKTHTFTEVVHFYVMPDRSSWRCPSPPLEKFPMQCGQ